MEFVTVGGADPSALALAGSGGSGSAGVGNGLAPFAYAPPVAGGVYNLQGFQGPQLLSAPPASVPATSFTLPPAVAPASAPASASAPAPAASRQAAGGGAAPAASGAATAGPAPASAKPAADGPAPADGDKGPRQEYTVKRRDSLSKIGAAHGVKWQELYELNKDVVGKNPNLIRPGQVLKIPAKPGGAPAAAAGNQASATPGAPAAGPAGGGPSQPDIPQLKKQLTHVDSQIAEGNRLVTQFYGQLQMTAAPEARATIQQGIDQMLIDNEVLQQLRRFLLQQLGAAAPQETSIASQLAAM